MEMVDLNKKQRNVYQVIQRNPSAANDDAILLERYWVEVDGWDESKSLYWNLSRVTRPETITRRRRELYNMGLITYSEAADKSREEAYINEKQYAAIPWLKDAEECAV